MKYTGSVKRISSLSDERYCMTITLCFLDNSIYHKICALTCGRMISSPTDLYKKKRQHNFCTVLVGADDGARTRYLHLGKVALYQMSYGRILHVASRGVAPGDVDYYTASRGRCQHPICIFCNFGSKRPTFGPASCNLQFQTSLHHVIGRPMTIQFRSGSAPLMRRKFICIPHRELL